MQPHIPAKAETGSRGFPSPDIPACPLASSGVKNPTWSYVPGPQAQLVLWHSAVLMSRVPSNWIQDSQQQENWDSFPSSIIQTGHGASYNRFRTS